MKLLALFSLLAIALFSCNRVLYVPNALHMPLLEQKNDYNLNFSTRFVGAYNLDFRSSYAPLDHLVLTMSGLTMKGDIATYDFKQSFAEAGVGLFQAFDDGGSGRPMRMELLGGYGLGNGANIDKDDFRSDNLNFRFQRKFLQPAMGLKMKNIELAMGVRLAEVNIAPYKQYINNTLVDKGAYNFTTLEPELRLAFGKEGIKVAFQVGRLTARGGKEDYEKATGDDWLRALLYLSFNIGNWNDASPPVPPIAFASPNSTSPNPQQLVIPIYNKRCWACFRRTGPSGDGSLNLRFNGAIIRDGLRPVKSFTCFELNALPDLENLLSIQLEGKGKNTKQRIQILLRDGKVERRFFLNLEAGKAENIYLKL